MKKRLLAIFLALTMCLALVPVAAIPAFADVPYTDEEGFVVKEGALIGYVGQGGKITIPSTVYTINIYAFADCADLISITIPQSVSKVEPDAFKGCSNLTSIIVSGDNQYYVSVDGVLFSRAMDTLIAYPGGKEGAYTIPDSVKNIDILAFDACVGLNSVAMGGNVTSIGMGAFSNCTNLTGVTIGSGVTSIEGSTFECCESLTSVAIPSSVTRIGRGAFYECSALKDLYYGGSKTQWEAIEAVTYGEDEFSFRNELINATIHYNSTGPDQPTTPDKPDSSTAHASAQTVTVDGKPVEFQMYALKDASGNDTNYIKLRDMAYVLNSTKAQFSVGYNAQDKTITATTGAAYDEDGTEMKATFGGADKEYTKTTLTIQLDGKTVQLEAITLTDDAGGGYNYCKVRDLGKTFNFNVDWNAGMGIYIESDKPYSGQ